MIKEIRLVRYGRGTGMRTKEIRYAIRQISTEHVRKKKIECNAVPPSGQGSRQYGCYPPAKKPREKKIIIKRISHSRQGLVRPAETAPRGQNIVADAVVLALGHGVAAQAYDAAVPTGPGRGPWVKMVGRVGYVRMR